MEIKALNVAGTLDLIIDVAVVHEFHGKVAHPGRRLREIEQLLHSLGVSPRRPRHLPRRKQNAANVGRCSFQRVCGVAGQHVSGVLQRVAATLACMPTWHLSSELARSWQDQHPGCSRNRPTFNPASDELLPIKLLKTKGSPASPQRGLSNLLLNLALELGCENGSLASSAQGAGQLLYSKLAAHFGLKSWNEMTELPGSNTARPLHSHSQLHHHISHRSQEFNLFRLHLLYAATVGCTSQMSSQHL